MNSGKYFVITRYPVGPKPTDIGFSPTGDERVPDEYLSFKTDVEKVVLTINALFDKDEMKRLDLYEQAYLSATVCFSGKESDLFTASQALAEIKKKILASSWVIVRNRIMGTYGIFALIAMALCGAAEFWFKESVYNLPAILTGSCLGSWLSISLKTGNLQFDEIYENISQWQSLAFRLVYCCVLSTVASLFLFTGIIEITIGQASTSMISQNGMLAIATGVLFGLAESSLASKLSQKASEVFS